MASQKNGTPMELDQLLVNSSYYRPVDSHFMPWEASPTALLPIELPGLPARIIPQYHSPPPGSIKISLDLETNQSNTYTHKFLRRIKRLCRRDVNGIEISLMDPSELEIRSSPRIPLSEWKAFGYAARPLVNGVYVRNASPGPKISVRFDPEEMAAGLRSADGIHPGTSSMRSPIEADFFAELWIAGTKHEGLPERPSLWQPPVKGEELPFPPECVLNPMLCHCPFGRSPIDWHLDCEPNGILFNGPDDGVIIPLGEPDLAQPATWPFLSHMYINSVSDDPAPKFRWPIMIRNPDGITVEDVLVGIFTNLQEYVFIDEFRAWTEQRRRQAQIALDLRREQQQSLGQEIDQAVRRIDYFGSHITFRGLEPHPNLEGWVLFIGLS
ncbi:hypothetical protein C8J56DRAFT_1021200 [Mycena floridula]|nr:hypothetical protein C8J56DRAFT_1021200 [Mycena floridula]